MVLLLFCKRTCHKTLYNEQCRVSIRKAIKQTVYGLRNISSAAASALDKRKDKADNKLQTLPLVDGVVFIMFGADCKKVQQ